MNSHSARSVAEPKKTWRSLNAFRLSEFLTSGSSFSKDIKIVHSVFALPFVAAALLIGSFPIPSVTQGVLLLVCMIAARSFAMGINRYLDRDIDEKNPRTKARMIPSGKLDPVYGLAWTLCSGVVFVGSAWGLSSLAGLLAVPTLIVLGTYPFMKRWTWLTHWYLGACLGLAPIAANIALSGTVEAAILLLGLAVMFWVGGFDIIYALQDWEFDRDEELKSLPVKLGPRQALMVSRWSFAVMMALLILVGVLAQLGTAYYLGLIAIGAILATEHWAVRRTTEHEVATDVNAAFLGGNAAVSIVYFLCVQLDYLF